MSVEMRPRRAYHNDSIRRHSLNMALMSDISSKKTSRDSLTEPIRQVSLEEHLDPIKARLEFENCDEVEVGNLASTNEVILDNPDLSSADSPDLSSPKKIPTKEEEEELEDLLESFDTNVLQMEKSRMVGSSLNNQMVAESLNISPDNSSVADDIVAVKVPTVADIPRPSIISEADIRNVNGSEAGDLEIDTIVEDTPIEEIDDTPIEEIEDTPIEILEAEPKATSSPSKEVYTLVEADVKFRVKPTPDRTVKPAVSVSPIYAEVIKTVPSEIADLGPLPNIPLESAARPASLALTQQETKELLNFINNKISSRSQLDIAPEPPIPETPISVKEVETSPPEEVNDLNEEKPDGAKPKLSFMNKLKKSFKSCNSDKNKSPTIPQLSRPPSSYIGSQMSLNHSSVHGSVHSLTLQHAPPLEKPQTPVLELLSKNPEMCSQDSLNRITRMPEVQAEEVGEVKAVMSDPDLVASTTTGRSRSAKRDDKTKRRSRSKSLTKLIGGMARKAKSLTNVSPIPKKSEDKSPDYVNDIPGGGSVAPPVPLSPPPPLPVAEPEVEEEKPEKKPRLSLVGRLKRKLSIGRGDKAAKVEKRKELSKSTPVLNQGPPPASALPLHIKRAKSTENMSTTSSVTTTTDVRTQIVLKSAKINKGCRCQVCSLVRRNIRSHCNSADPNSRHKYEVVLKMNILGGDFMNSECGSVASYQGNQGYEVPDEERPDIVEGCIAGNIDAEISSIHSVDNQLRTKTQSEIHELVADFQQETKSVSSHHSHQSDTDNDMSELRNLISTPLSELRSSPSLTPRQSAV